MRGFICANVCIGILLVSIEISAALERAHQEIINKAIPETFDTSEIRPEYEAVPIVQSHISKRNVYYRRQTSLHMKSLGYDISKWVQAPDVALFTLNTPVYSVKNTYAGPRFSVYTNVMRSYLERIYQEYVSTYTNQRWRRQVNETHNAVNNEKNFSGSSEDVSKSQQEYYYNSNVHEYIMNNTSEDSGRPKRSYRDTVYPEILVIVDYNFFKTLGENVYNTIKYLVGFWNGVDLVFRSLESPKFRLNIAAILIAEDESALSYVTSNKIQSKYLAGDSAIVNSQTWLYESLSSIIDKNNYDLAVTMTSLKLCSTKITPGYCTPGSAGMSAFGWACGVDDNYHLIMKTLIIQDDGAFRGIQVAAHELGHSFGANHEGDSYDFPCQSQGGTIMDAHEVTGIYSNSWSQCSLMAMDRFLKAKGSCLYNKPNLNDRVTPFLPGKMMSADQQCKAQQGAQSAKVDESICQHLQCYTHYNAVMSIQKYAAPGTKCGYQKMCLNSQCVREI